MCLSATQQQSSRPSTFDNDMIMTSHENEDKDDQDDEGGPDIPSKHLRTKNKNGPILQKTNKEATFSKFWGLGGGGPELRIVG